MIALWSNKKLSEIDQTMHRAERWFEAAYLTERTKERSINGVYGQEPKIPRTVDNLAARKSRKHPRYDCQKEKVLGLREKPNCLLQW